MERRQFLGISCFSAAARLAFMTESFAAASPPNIVFFLVDDMGWQDISEPVWSKYSAVPSANEKTCLGEDGAAARCAT
jgi:hypothetical protein